MVSSASELIESTDVFPVGMDYLVGMKTALEEVGHGIGVPLKGITYLCTLPNFHEASNFALPLTRYNNVLYQHMQNNEPKWPQE